MRTIEEVRATILSTVRRLPTETVPFQEAMARVLAAAVVAPHDVPSFTNSAMDGYAVRAADVASPGAVLEVVEDVAAGQVPLLEVGEGQAIKIMTGAPVPRGADTVVRVEDTEAENGKVRINVSVQPGTSVRPPGGDVAAGTVVFAEGVRLSAAHIGVLATIGVVSPVVSRRPRVAVMSTGDELVPPDTIDLSPGHIRDSNRHMLLALVAEAGATPVDMGTIFSYPNRDTGLAGHGTPRSRTSEPVQMDFSDDIRLKQGMPMPASNPAQRIDKRLLHNIRFILPLLTKLRRPQRTNHPQIRPVPGKQNLRCFPVPIPSQHDELLDAATRRT